jgi:hypothetical protein
MPLQNLRKTSAVTLAPVLCLLTVLDGTWKKPQMQPVQQLK